MLCYVMMCYAMMRHVNPQHVSETLVCHHLLPDRDGEPVELHRHPVRRVHGALQGGQLRQAERLLDNQDEEETPEEQNEGAEQRELRHRLATALNEHKY